MRPPPDPSAPLHSPAWWSFALACGESAIEQGQSVEWNRGVVERIRKQQGWGGGSTLAATVVATEVALQLSPSTTAFLGRLRTA